MIYTFEHPTSGEVVDIEQSMNDEHIYVDNDGIVWNRIFHVPQAIIGAKVDPWSQKQFMEKTAGKNQKVGDLFTRAEELSQMRAAQNNGVDPIKAKSEKEYSKIRRGQKAATPFKDLNVKIDTKKLKK